MYVDGVLVGKTWRVSNVRIMVRSDRNAFSAYLDANADQERRIVDAIDEVLHAEG